MLVRLKNRLQIIRRNIMNVTKQNSNVRGYTVIELLLVAMVSIVAFSIIMVSHKSAETAQNAKVVSTAVLDIKNVVDNRFTTSMFYKLPSAGTTAQQGGEAMDLPSIYEGMGTDIPYGVASPGDSAKFVTPWGGEIQATTKQFAQYVNSSLADRAACQATSSDMTNTQMKNLLLVSVTDVPNEMCARLVNYLADDAFYIKVGRTVLPMFAGEGTSGSLSNMTMGPVRWDLIGKGSSVRAFSRVCSPKARPQTITAAFLKTAKVGQNNIASAIKDSVKACSSISRQLASSAVYKRNLAQRNMALRFNSVECDPGHGGPIGWPGGGGQDGCDRAPRR